MSDTAIQLVEYVFPKDVPVRQFVLTFPIEVRRRLGFDARLLTQAHTIFMRAIRAFYRRRSKRLGYTDSATGAVTCIQRAGSALNLAPHFHSLVLDGVYVENDGEVGFVQNPPPTDDEIKTLTETIAKRIVRTFIRRGVIAEGYVTHADKEEEQELLSEICEASTRNLIAMGPNRGRRVRRVLLDPPQGESLGNLCFAASGFTLHAATSVEAGDSEDLERLCRYITRPPVATESLSVAENGDVIFKMKRKFSDGTQFLRFTGPEFLEKLAALTPQPRVNQIRYCGILGARAKNRKEIVPQPPFNKVSPCELSETEPAKSEPWKRPARIRWAQLLRRVFKADAETCDSCGGEMRIIQAVVAPSAIKRYLEYEGLEPRPPPIAKANIPIQELFEF